MIKKLFLLMSLSLLVLGGVYAQGALSDVGGIFKYNNRNVCLNGGSYDFSAINDIVYINPGDEDDLYSKINGANNQDFYVPCGIYELENQINLGKNVTIEGSGICTLIKPSASFSDDFIFYMGNSSVQGIIDPNDATTLVQNSVIKDIYFDGNKDNTVNVGFMKVNYSQEFKINDNWFKNFETDVLSFITSKKVEIEGNWFGGSGSSFTGGDILDIATGGDFTIVNNHFHDFNGAIPIKITSNSNKISITANIFYSGTNEAINIGSTGDEEHHISIIGNTFATISDNAIVSNSANARGINIVGNNFRNLDFGALYLRGDAYSISDNYMYTISGSCSGDFCIGVFLKDGSSNNVITNNRIYGGGSMSYGIGFNYGTIEDNFISNNQIFNYTVSPIREYGSDNIYFTNTAEDNSLQNDIDMNENNINDIGEIKNTLGGIIKNWEVTLTDSSWVTIDSDDTLRFRGVGDFTVFSSSNDGPGFRASISHARNGAAGDINVLNNQSAYTNNCYLDMKWDASDRVKLRALGSDLTNCQRTYTVMFIGMGEFTFS